MLFSSLIFLYLFLPAVLLCYYAVDSLRFRNSLLLIASLLFYAWGEGALVLLMVLSIAWNYWTAIRISQCLSGNDQLHARYWLSAGITVDLLFLIFFKYADFLVGNLNVGMSFADLPRFELPGIHLPVGISFFTFQAISYLVDVYKNPQLKQDNVFKVGLYISLFPQLIAGPIVRYGDIAGQLNYRQLNTDEISYGIKRFISGLAKKLLIADTLGEVADKVFDLPVEAMGPDVAFLGVVCYTLQIYFDFSGYSDMAIGLGRMFGFRIMENFNYPYIARSVREFWRRWHISLSTWFRDYLYIPLGGNRKGSVQTYVNLLIVFFLCGLWHGSNWTFVIWGLFHGLFLVIERVGLGKLLEKLPPVFGHLYTLIVVMTAWVFFRADTLPDALNYFSALFGMSDAPWFYAGFFLDKEIICTLIVGSILSTPVIPYLESWVGEKGIFVPNPVVRLGSHLFFLLLLMVTGLYAAGHIYNPFIYFRF